MTRMPDYREDVYDDSPDFVYAVSLFAALEGEKTTAGFIEALPYLGMARSELVAHGARQTRGFVEARYAEPRAGLAELTRRLEALLAASDDLEQSLQIVRSLELLAEARQAAAW